MFQHLYIFPVISEPRVSDYNVNVIEGIRNISITWETVSIT